MASRAKRTATSELNHDNWDQEADREEAGQFRQASKDVIQNRVIKKARRRGVAAGGEDKSSLFSGFNFAGAGAAAAAPKASFDFLKSAATPPVNPLAGNEKAATSASANNGSSAKPLESADAVKPAAGGFNFAGLSKPAAETAAKKWSCPDCMAQNNDEQLECPCCGKAKPGAPAKKKEDAPPVSFGTTGGFNFAGLSKPATGAGAKKWACPDCMAQNNDDQLECPCCGKGKPGAPAKKKEEAPVGFGAAGGFKFGASAASSGSTATSSAIGGFKFGASTTAAATTTSSPGSSGGGFKFGATATSTATTTSSPGTASTGFKIGSTAAGKSDGGFAFGSASAAKPNVDNNTEKKSAAQNSSDEKINGKSFSSASTSPEKSNNGDNDRYYKRLTTLNQQVTAWIKQHVDSNPLIKLTPIFEDYKKHLAELEREHRTLQSTTSSSSSSNSNNSKVQEKPLLGAVFGTPPANNSNKDSPSSRTEVKTTTSTGTTATFSFGTSAAKPANETAPKSTSSSGLFSFGSTASTTKPTTTSAPFSFGTASSTSSSGANFSFGSKNSEGASTGNFSFASSSKKTEEPASAATSAGTFSFGSKNTEGAAAGTFSFGAKTGESAGGFSFANAVPPQPPAQGQNEEEDAEDEPPKVEVKTVEEEGSFHSVKCKLFYKLKSEFKEKGLGMLHLKKLDSGKTQMVVRAETNLGNILLNVLLNEQMKPAATKNNVQFVCMPNPPIKEVEGPAFMLIKVKEALMAQELVEKMKANSN